MAIQAQLYSDNIVFPSCGSLDWIDNGCGVVGVAGSSFQHHQNHHDKNQSLELIMLRQNMMSSQLGNQRQEIDQFIKSQNEMLRLLLQEQRTQVAVLMKKVESKAFVLLRQKDEEIAKAEYKSMELQNMVKRLEMENQAWQRVARENEAMVLSLNNTLEQVREQGYCRFDNGVVAEDAESCCECEGDKETEENREEEEKTTRVCKGCYCRSSCVLFLPCRHLCSCKECAALLDSCPVCRAPKKASIEALVS